MIHMIGDGQIYFRQVIDGRVSLLNGARMSMPEFRTQAADAEYLGGWDD